MAKKLTKQELEQDPLLNSYARTQAFYENNKNVIIGSAIVVILAIGLAIGYHYYEISQNKKAERLMGVPESYYMRGQYKKALNGSSTDFTSGFKQIMNNYSGTKAGNLAHYYAAVSAFNLGKPKQALRYLKDFNIPDGILGVAPLSFKGVLYMENGMPDKAAITFVNAAKLDKNDSTTPYNFMQAAEAFEQAGDQKKAKKYARKVVNKYPDSQQVTQAKKLLGRLGDTKQ